MGVSERDQGSCLYPYMRDGTEEEDVRHFHDACRLKQGMHHK